MSKQKQLGLSGKKAEKEEPEESDSSDEKPEDDRPEPTKEELEETKKKEKAQEELEKKIIDKYKAAIEKEEAAKALQEKDEKEKVSVELKGLADTLRKELGDDYPESFNHFKIAPRIDAMIGLKNAIEKRKMTEPIQKGKSTIPKPKGEEKKIKRTRLTKDNSYKELAKSFPWTQDYEKKTKK